MEGLLQRLSGLLRLVAVTCKPLRRGAAVTLSGVRVLFAVSCGGGHGTLLASV